MRPIDADALKAEMEVAPMYATDMYVACAVIDEAPTIEVEPVIHAYWIPVDGGDSCDEWDCSACDSRMTFMCEMDYDDMREDFPRCPKCGARMDVEED